MKSIVAGAEGHREKQARFLNSILSWEREGIVYEPDPRRGEIIVRDLGLQTARGLKVPMVQRRDASN